MCTVFDFFAAFLIRQSRRHFQKYGYFEVVAHFHSSSAICIENDCTDFFPRLSRQRKAIMEARSSSIENTFPPLRRRRKNIKFMVFNNLAYNNRTWTNFSAFLICLFTKYSWFWSSQSQFWLLCWWIQREIVSNNFIMVFQTCFRHLK